MIRRVLGVDGGGTRTRAVVVAEDGAVLGEGHSGPAHPRQLGRARTHEHLREAIARAFEQADVTSTDYAFLGIAGVATADERHELADWTLGVGVAGADGVEVDHDLRAALAGGLAGRPGVVVVAGTGSCVFGRTEDGREARAGGLGAFVDDPGSGFDLGRSALVAAVQALDGRGEPSGLEGRVRERWGIHEARPLALAAAEAPREKVASLAVEVTGAAEEGDAVARAIVERAVDGLAACVGVVARRLGPGAPQWSYAGGVTRSPLFLEALRAAVNAHAPELEAVEPRLTADRGAALLALHHLGVPASESLVDRLAGPARAR